MAFKCDGKISDVITQIKGPNPENLKFSQYNSRAKNTDLNFYFGNNYVEMKHIDTAAYQLTYRVSKDITHQTGDWNPFKS